MKRIPILLLPVMLMAPPAPAFACKCAEPTAESSRKAIDDSALIVKGMVERVFITRKGADINKAAVTESGAEVDIEDVYKGDYEGATVKFSYDSQTDCAVPLNPGSEGEFIIRKDGGSYKLAGQCEKLTAGDWEMLRAGRMKPKAEEPAAEAGCKEGMYDFAAGAYEVLGHTPEGDDKGHLYSGAVQIAAQGCKLTVKRCDTRGVSETAELRKTRITADDLVAWQMDTGGRHYMFEAEGTNGNYALFHGQYSEGDSDISSGREFWYPRQEEAKPACEFK
jgi:hypothetical protein